MAIRIACLRAVGMVALLATLACQHDDSVITVALVEIGVPPGPFRISTTAQFSATARDARGRPLTDRAITWSTSDATVATIDGAGLMRALRAGAVTVQATIEGRSGAVAITIIAPTPRITSLTPGELPFGATVLSLVVEGVDFVQGSAVRLNEQERATTFVSSARLTATLNQNDVFNVGVHNVTVLNPEASGGESQAFAFTVNTPVRGPFLASRTEYSCGIAPNGEALCWGRNFSGQLGDNTTTDRTVPTRVSTSLRFVAIGVGTSHTLCTGGIRRGPFWGSNSRGQLGDGTVSGRITPVAVAGNRFFLAIAVGTNFTCGLDSQGQAWCWGDNAGGQLGDGTNANRSMPTAVAGNLVFRVLSAGESYACGVTTGNEVYCWGFNSLGSLGTGDTSNRSSPARVLTPVPIATVSAGYIHTCAVANNGNAYCWGHNGTRALGNGQPLTAVFPCR
ncbi:MAG: Ig-like domain-containing protein [Longimicrobiales bacterium]